MASPVLPLAIAAPLVVQVHPARSIVPQGGSHSLRCQVTGSSPHYFYWSREDGRPMPSSTQQRHQGTQDPGPLGPVSHPSGKEGTVLFAGILSGWEGRCLCPHELPTIPHQALSSTSPVSSPRMPASTSAPVVISITPTAAGQSCWSPVSPCSPPPQALCGCAVDTVRGCLDGGAGHGDGEMME